MSMEDLCVYDDKNGKRIVPWKVEGKFILQLLTPEEYRMLPMGTMLGSILGNRRIKSEDSDIPKSENYIDQDTRFGRLAYGVIWKELS